tara:strand:+ start:383 stop:667 length:285 start_codon:yes stop_codon:yes gene_type:complete
VLDLLLVLKLLQLVLGLEKQEVYFLNHLGQRYDLHHHLNHHLHLLEDYHLRLHHLLMLLLKKLNLFLSRLVQMNYLVRFLLILHYQLLLEKKLL